MSNYQLSIDHNQLPEGYKQTEVGVIPKDWDVCYLHQISKKITDGEHATPKRATEGYYLLSARNVHDGRIDLIDVDFVGVDEYQRIRKRCDPDTGDVLISCSGTIGRVAVLPTGLECVMVRSAALIKPDRSKTDGYFIQYVLQSRVGQIQIAQTLNQGAQANLFINHIEGLKVPFPHLPEQRSIAQALSDVDALIAALEKAIAKKRAIKTATMQQLLTGKKRLLGFGEGKGYKETAIGVLPEDWNCVEAGTVISFFGGYGFSSRFESSAGIRWLKIANVGDERIKWDDVSYLPAQFQTEFKDYLLQPNDVVMALTRPILDNKLKVARLTTEDSPALLNQRVAKLLPQGNTEATYLYYVVQRLDFVVAMNIAMAGSDPPNIGNAALEKILIAVPQLQEEQRSIATVLSDMDAEIAALETRLTKIQSIKQGMMQQLLTGRTRLI